MKGNGKKNVIIGKQFENEIRNILELTGYLDPECQVSIDDDIIDVVAYYNSPTGKRKIIVEAKNLNKRIDKDIVDIFSAKLLRIKNIDHGIIISKKGFTPRAISVARKSTIPLLLRTPEQLVKGLMNFEPGIRNMINIIKNKEVMKYYIPMPVEKPSGDPINCSLDDNIFTRLNDKNKKPILILGSYGMGKTTFCEQLYLKLGQEYLNEKEKPIPILIKLRDCSNNYRLKDLITSHIINTLGVTNFSFSQFIWLANHGSFVLILDGIDEMPCSAPETEIISNLSDIGKIISNCPNSILTCRPEFFRTEEDVENILQYCTDDNERSIQINRLKLKYWTDTEVQKYLKCRYENPQPLLKLINSIRDLRDLSKRPVLMNMICETGEELKLLMEKSSSGTRITSSKLYETYIRKILDEDIKQHKTNISTEVRFTLAMFIAGEVSNKSPQSLTFGELVDLLEKYKLPKRDQLLKAATREIFSRSLLIRDQSDRFCFSHSSFIDFFVGYFVAEWIEGKLHDINGSEILIKKLKVTSNISQFIADIFCDEKRFNEILRNPLFFKIGLTSGLFKIEYISEDFKIKIANISSCDLFNILKNAISLDSNNRLIFVHTIFENISADNFERLCNYLLTPTKTLTRIWLLFNLCLIENSFETQFVRVYSAYVEDQLTFKDNEKLCAIINLRNILSMNYKVFDRDYEFPQTFTQKLIELQKKSNRIMKNIIIKNIKIRSLNLEQKNISNINFYRIAFDSCKFNLSTFSDSSFINCIFNNCEFHGSSFDSGLDLTSCSFNKCDFSDAILHDCVIDFKSKKQKNKLISMIRGNSNWELAYWPKTISDLLGLADFNKIRETENFFEKSERPIIP